MDSSTSLVAFGIPTVDFSFLVSDKSVIDKHNLQIDSQHEKTTAFLDGLKNEFYERQYEFKKITGGNSQISSMIFQSLLKVPYQTVMCGAVGDDDEGIEMDKSLSKKLVKTSFDKVENTKSAATVIIVHKSSRTVAATNGAGEVYSTQNWRNMETHLNLVRSSSLVLFEGFFIGFSSDIVAKVVETCNLCGTAVAMNLSGSYVAQKYSQQLLDCLKSSDILIGNRGEFDLFCDSIGMQHSASFTSRVKALHRMMTENSAPKHRMPGAECWKKILIVTNNKEPIYCVYGDGIVLRFPVPRLEDAKIVDTCGAGDSFLGAFLYALVKQKPIEKCLEIGCAVSSSVIQCHGYEIDENTLNKCAA